MGSETLAFDPDYCVPPGCVLREWIQETGVSRAEVARSLGISWGGLSLLIAGDMDIGRELAAKLGAETGISPGFWLAREKRHREFLERREL